MAFLIGIDEAGYGPLLGPLVVSSAAFEIPDDLIRADLWKLLGDSVGKNRANLRGRLLINDSKQAYNKTIGIKHLERTTLASLAQLSHNPAKITDLLDILCPECIPRLHKYRWYKDIDTHSLGGDASDIKLVQNVFARDLRKNQMRMVWLKTQCLDVAHYNGLVDAAKNKSTVLFNTAAALMQHALENAKSDNIQIVIDRQGGRADYTPLLRRSFPDMALTILRQDEIDSSYELRDGKKSMRVHFVVGADGKFLPVALASMVCKYVRELLTGCMNDYFVEMCPDLKPTAGYWKDGTRFIEDLKRVLPDYKYDASKLIRIK